jgi:glycosyltransferase involved in cell wall biosynthesis
MGDLKDDLRDVGASPEVLSSEAMKANVRVSVVVPFLNAERFLRESVESVLAQTYASWELLLVDDGSSDGSSAIAREFARDHPDRIRHIEHPGHANRGISASRNLGIAEARGDLIAMLDADDVWLPGKLEHHVPLMDAHPDVGMLYGNSLYWYGWSGRADDASRDHLPYISASTNTVLDAKAMLLTQLRGECASPCPCAVMLQKSVAESVGGSDDAFRGTHEDLVLYAKMMLAAPIFVVEGWWDRYRCYSGPSDSVTTIEQKDGVLNTTRRRYLEWLADYLQEHGLGDSEHYRLVVETIRRNYSSARSRLVRHGRRYARAFAAALRTLRPGAPPRVAWVRMGHLRRVTPINRHWGLERGQPIDRHYIEAFLAQHAADVRGRVLEVGDNAYTRRYGTGKVSRSDVLDISPTNPRATIVADLADAPQIADDRFDCIIVTQTLQYVYDVRAAFWTLHRILAPGGTLLVTVPGISQTTDERLRHSWYWLFTVASVTRLAIDVFPERGVDVTPRGNVLTAVSFLHGLAQQDLRPEEFAHDDRDFPLVITLCARKPAR